MPSVGGINSSQNSALWQLVQSYLTTERAPLTRLEASRTELGSRTTGFQDLKTRLQTLRGAIDDFRWAGVANPLSQMRAAASEPAALGATAGPAADPGRHTIVVSALACSHSLAGDELAAADAFGAGGSFDFTLTQHGESTTISVLVAEGATQGEVLDQVAAALRASGASVRATVVTSDAALGLKRLLLTSTETGTAALISGISDENGDLAARLGLAGSSSAGAYSANTVQAAADAAFSVDGLALTAAGNTVADVIPGLTLQLLRAGDGPVTLTVERDASAVQSNLQTVIDAYNEAVDFVREQTRAADADGENRGAFTGNATFQALRSELRRLASDPVAAITTPGAPRRLADLGVTADATGRLTLSDPGALAEALQGFPAEVERLFSDESDGLAVRIDERLERYVEADGRIARETDALAARRSTLERSITRLEERLARREQTLLNELTTLQTMIASLSAQQSTLSQLYRG